MITKFDSSYVGTVDLEDAGYLGTPINDRWYSNEELATSLHKAVAYAKLMDGLGYNTFWMAEHHFQPEGTECIPNLLMMAMHLCARDQEPQASAAASTSRRCGIRCGWPKTTPWPTS